MASMLYISLFVMMMFVACTLCSPIKRSATDQQATGCQGTECYFDPDYMNPGKVTVKFPENLTEVVLTVLPLIPDMMGKHEQQINNLTAVVEKMAIDNLTDKVTTVLPLIPELMEKHEQQLKNLTTVMDNMSQTTTVVAQLTSVVAQLLQSQLTLLSERLPVPTPSSSSSSSPPSSPPSTTPSSTSSPPTSTPSSPPPRDCQDIADAGSHQSGVNTITPQDGLGSSQVYCDTDTDGGGWTVFQKRFDGSVDFYLGWESYETGFGSAYGEYWAGLSLIHRLTQSGNWQLRIDLEAFDGDTAYAMYDSFRIGGASSNYRLTIDSYSGSAGDSLQHNNNMPFSSTDRKSVQISNSISVKGGWWYTSGSYDTNLNNQYFGQTANSNCCKGIVWFGWKQLQSLKRTEMKMRRIN